jgi:acyl-CoA synthetase (AMP-forming)/AMP-acid ligase II
MESLEDRPFLVHQGQTYGYEELVEEIRTANLLLKKVGVEPGDSVALQGDFSFRSIALFFSLYQNRNIIAPIVTISSEELDIRKEESYADWLVDWAGQEIKFQRVKRRKEYHDFILELHRVGHSGLVLFSSGTTGRPKSMIHDLNKMMSAYEGRKVRQLSILIFLMFDHIGGLNTLFGALAGGALLVVPTNRDAEEVGKLIEKNKVNVLPASPTFLNLMVLGDIPGRFNLSSLRIISYGTEPMPESLLRKIKETFPRVRLLQTFGTSETGIVQTQSKSSSSLSMKLDDPSIDYKIVAGELWLKSKTQIMGYMNHSMQRFTDDGWFRTGDLVDDEGGGFIKIIGRNSDVINVGGEKVLPAEIESLLLEMDEIVDCLVCAQPNAITGQAVLAKVVLASGGETAEIKRKIRSFLSGKVARYKIPQIVKILKHLPIGTRFKKERIPETSEQMNFFN